MNADENRIARIISYLDVLGIQKVDITGNYNDRVIVQKMTFIMDTLVNGKVPSDFAFHIKGPYSHSLTVAYFEHKNMFESKPTYVLKESERAQAEKIARALSDHHSTDDLEIVASLLYLVKKNKLSYDEAELELKKRKPHLSEEAIWRGTNILKPLLLSDRDRDEHMKAIAEELAQFNSAANEDERKFL